MLRLNLKAFRAKARSLRRAVFSFLRSGDAALILYEDRQQECLACPHLRRTTHGIFCAECGCPPWVLSDLRTKWRMPEAACPLLKW